MVSVLSVCSQVEAAEEGELIHGLILKIGIETYVNLSNALINMFASRGNIGAMRLLFDSAQMGDCVVQVSRNSMIAGCVECGLLKEAKEVFDKMPQKDLVSWSTMISGYCKHDRFSEALSPFHEMHVGEIIPLPFGLISTSPPAPIRIAKNLQICSDCRAAAKIISKAFQRESY